MSKIRIYNHQFLNDDGSWVYIYLDQLKQMEDYGLIDAAESIKITGIGNEQQLDLFTKLSGTYPKLELFPMISNATSTEIVQKFGLGGKPERDDFISETPTIKRLWEDSKTENFYALYFHGKGASSFPKDFKTGNVQKFKNYYYWKKFLEWGVLENWRKCVFALDHYHDLAGCNFNIDPWPHFSGNFWWANSTYIRTLDDVSNSPWWKSVQKHYHVDRLVNEMWPCHKAKNIFNLNSPPARLCSPNPGLYSETYVRKQYAESN